MCYRKVVFRRIEIFNRDTDETSNKMAYNVSMVDLSAFVSLDDIPEAEKQPPQLSRQQSRIFGHLSGSNININAKKPSNDLQMTEKEIQGLVHTKTFLRVQADIKEKQKRVTLNAVKPKPQLENRESEQLFYVDKAKQIATMQGIICENSYKSTKPGQQCILTFK